MPTRGRYYTQHRNGRYVEHDKAQRYNHGYAESPATLARLFSEGLERTRLRLEQQREELARLAKIRR
jgi:hypothetical protein